MPADEKDSAAVPGTDAEVAASERERRRISHDLHDGLGQLLGGIALKAEVLRQMLAEQALPEAEAAAEIVKLANEATAQTRLLARELDPVVPVHVPFAVSLTKLATDTERLFRGVACRLTGDSALVIESAHTAQHLFRIAQEALNNAIRHGRATRIEIGFAADAREIQLEIRDNGTGLTKRGTVSGIGLRIMKHRANALGGTLDIVPGETGGTRVQCRVPLTPPPSA
jgi:signal transduction histidine kinase